MSAAHVRRGASGRSRPKKAARVSVPKKIASKLPVEQAEANRLAAWAFGLFVVAIVGVALVALDVPAKLGIAAGEFAELVRAMRNGATYVNVHSVTYPAGEIRGNIRRD